MIAYSVVERLPVLRQIEAAAHTRPLDAAGYLAYDAAPAFDSAPRGKTQRKDQANIDWLHRSDKNRAENVMIVDAREFD